MTLAAVLWLTLAPFPVGDMETPSFLGPHADKIVHFVMFGGLTGVIIFDCTRARFKRGAMFYICLLIGMLAFAALDEWAQGAMNMGRSADIKDFAADSTGISTAIIISLIIALIRSYFHRR